MLLADEILPVIFIPDYIQICILCGAPVLLQITQLFYLRFLCSSFTFKAMKSPDHAVTSYKLFFACLLAYFPCYPVHALVLL